MFFKYRECHPPNQIQVSLKRITFTSLAYLWITNRQSKKKSKHLESKFSLLSIIQQAKSGSKYIPINLQSFKTSFAYSYPVCLNHLSPDAGLLIIQFAVVKVPKKWTKWGQHWLTLTVWNSDKCWPFPSPMPIHLRCNTIRLFKRWCSYMDFICHFVLHNYHIKFDSILSVY